MFKRLVAICLLIVSATLADDATAGFVYRNARYLLQPNDVLEIQYRYTPEFNQTVSIHPDGFVSLTLVGELKIAGLSLGEVRKLLLEKSSARLRDPEISIILKDFEKPHFVVAGEVVSPGRFDLRGSISALEAVAVAGGLKNTAKHSQAILYRKVNSEVGAATLVDLKKIATIRGHDEDVELRPGDVLFIPQNRVSKVERFVRWGSWGVFANPVVR